MLERLTERRPLWEHLREAKKPIYLYGMGNGAEKILAVLERNQVVPTGIFASDGFVRGHSFAGFRVQSYGEVRERHGAGFIALLAFGINYEPMLSTLARMETECEFYAPDVPVVRRDEAVFDREYALLHERELEEVWNRLEDEQSRRVFLGTLNYKISGKPRYLREIESSREEAWTLLGPDGSGSYVDLGAYNGDTIEEYFRRTGGGKGRILALEPDPTNYSKLRRRLEALGIEADCRNLGAWSEEGTLYLKGGKGGRNSLLSKEGSLSVQVDSVDHLLEGGRADLIKLDVEGAESAALLGAAKTIAAYTPRLIVSAYHQNEDLFALPLQILSISSHYRFYLRHHPYIPAWDTVYYCVPS